MVFYLNMYPFQIIYQTYLFSIIKKKYYSYEWVHTYLVIIEVPCAVLDGIRFRNEPRHSMILQFVLHACDGNRSISVVNSVALLNSIKNLQEYI